MNLAVAVSAPRCDFVGARHSTLTHHGECCELAKGWLHSMHRSLTFSRTDVQSVHAPLWLNKRFKWGPVQWPISWCEAVQGKHVDCGVFAAFAREILAGQTPLQECTDRPAVEVFPAQVILDQPRTFTDQWSVKWRPVFGAFDWIGDKHVYHEVCAVVERGTSRVKVYDPTEAVWLEPVLERGINNVIGINIRSPRMLDWGHMRVGLEQWVML